MEDHLSTMGMAVYVDFFARSGLHGERKAFMFVYESYTKNIEHYGRALALLLLMCTVRVKP
jgi:hypothetical protein